MELFNVYSLYPIEPVRGKGCCVYDAAGTEYLDLYGGHAVISVGHSHPTYVKAITEQVSPTTCGPCRSRSHVSDSTPTRSRIRFR